MYDLAQSATSSLSHESRQSTVFLLETEGLNRKADLDDKPFPLPSKEELTDSSSELAAESPLLSCIQIN